MSRPLPRAASGPFRRTWQLRAAGWSKRSIAIAVDRGALLRVHRGLFAQAGTHPLHIEAARHGGVPACVTAAVIQGLWVLDADRLHVLLGTDGHLLRAHPDCSCIEHWNGPRREKGGLLSVEAALIQIAQCQGAEAFFVSLESALALHRLPVGWRDSIHAELPRTARKLLPLARAVSGSGTESLFYLRMQPHGLPLVSQPVLPDGRRRADFRIGDRMLVEIDSEQHHGGPEQRRRDLARDAEAAAWGFETLRFDYTQVRYAWASVEAAVLAKVAAGDHLRR